MHLEILLIKATTRKTDRICINISTYSHHQETEIYNINKIYRQLKWKLMYNGQLKC